MRRLSEETKDMLGSIATTVSLIGGVWLLITLINMKNEISPLIQDAIRERDKQRYERVEQNQDGRYYQNNYIIAFGELYKKEFVDAGKKYRLPPEIILAVFYPEFCAQTAYSKLGDDIATHIPYWNPSIGLGQVRIETAEKLAKIFGKNMTRDEIIVSLNTPQGAIEFVGMYLRDMIDHKKMGNSRDLFFDPTRLVELYAYYVAGIKPGEEGWLNGIGIMGVFHDNRFLEVFGTYSEGEQFCVLSNVGRFDHYSDWFRTKTIEIAGGASEGMKMPDPNKSRILDPKLTITQALTEIREQLIRDDWISTEGTRRVACREYMQERDRAYREQDAKRDENTRQFLEEKRKREQRKEVMRPKKQPRQEAKVIRKHLH